MKKKSPIIQKVAFNEFHSKNANIYDADRYSNKHNMSGSYKFNYIKMFKKAKGY